MPVTDRCLDAEQVRALLRDHLALEEMGPTLEHLERCPHCTDLLQRQAGDNTPLPRASALDALTEGPESSVIEGIIARLTERAGWKCPPGHAAEATPAAKAPPLTDTNWKRPPGHGSKATLQGADTEGGSFPFLAPPQAPDEMGRLGRYRLLRVLGSGGMGVVFLAEDTQLRRPVALKVMRPELSAFRAYRERFLREARSAATIEHDHIVTVYHAGEEGGVPMLAMQLLQGETLEDRLKREGKLPPAEAARIGREIAEALHAAHGQGLVHRDIKPGNVWLEGERRRVKVLDFGLARPLQGGGQLTQEGAIIGTPAYMAPEQAEGGAIDARVDLFSLGAVLYRMVTGEPPFRGEGTLALLRSLANDTPPPPHEVAPEVPVLLGKLIQRLLSKQTAGRPASASQVAAELAASEAGPPAQPQRPPIAPRRRRRLLLATAAACLLLAGTVAAMVALAPGVTLKVKTQDGELVLTVPQEGLKVFIDGKEHMHAGPEKSWRVALPPGKHHLQIKKGEAEVYSLFFTVKAGETASIVATWPPEVIFPPGMYKAGPGWRPSPLDKLKYEDVPASERFDWQPKGLVAVLGKSAWRHWYWGYSGENHPSLAFSSDGKQVIASSVYRYAARVWDAATGKELAYLPPPPLTTKGGVLLPGLQGVAIAPDNRTVAFLSGTREEWAWTVWDVATRKPRATIEGQNYPPQTVTFSPGAKLLATSWASRVVLWDGTSGKQLNYTDANSECLAFSPDGKLLAATSHKPLPGKNGLVVKVWDVTGASLKEKRVFEVPLKEAAQVAFSPDGALLAVGGESQGQGGAVQVVDLATGKQKRLFDWFKTGEGRILTFAFAPDGKTLAFVIGNGGVRLCDLTGKQRLVLGAGQILSLAFRPDSRALAVATLHGTIQVWDTDTGKQLNTVPETVDFLGLAPDDKTLATGAALTFWDVTTRKPIGTQTVSKTWNVEQVAFAPGEKTFAARLGGQVRVFDTATGELQAMLGPASAMSASRDGKTLAVMHWNPSHPGSGKLWDTSTWKERTSVEFPANTRYPLVVSPDGRYAAYGIGKAVRIQEVSTGKVKTTLAAPSDVALMAFSHDGKRLAAACALHPLKVWDLETDKEVFSVLRNTAHYGTLTGLTFGPDSKTVITSGSDGWIIHWRSAKDRTVWRFPGPTRVVSSFDGRYLFTVNGNGITIYVFRLAPPPAPLRKK